MLHKEGKLSLYLPGSHPLTVPSVSAALQASCWIREEEKEKGQRTTCAQQKAQQQKYL